MILVHSSKFYKKPPKSCMTHILQLQDPIPDRYSPDMEAQRIFDKMFDVDSKRSYMVGSHDDSPRCGYDIDASDCDDKGYHQVHRIVEPTLIT